MTADHSTPRNAPRPSQLRKIVPAVGIALVLALGASLSAGWMLIRPHRAVVGAAPADLDASSVQFATPQGRSLAGWLVRGRTGAGAILLMHGLHADRRQLVPVARVLAREGFTLLLFDFEAEGESDGDRISFGFRESDDARAALDCLRRAASGEKVGAIGRSMGGAAALLGTGPLDLDALVLESVYPDIEQAVAARIEYHSAHWLAAPLAPLLLWQLRPWLGIGPEDLRPVDAIRRLRAPLLVIGGDRDRYLPVEETRRLYDAAPQPKELWIVAGADHDRMRDAARAEYDGRVLDFLKRRLR